VRDSAVYAAEVFQSLTRSRGLVLPQARRPEAIPEGAVLASVESPPLFEIARDMLKYSNNLTAEVLGLTATTMRLGAAPTSLADSAAPMTAWARDVLGMTSSHFVDHSGLGEDSRVTTHDLCTALVRLGHDGTLRRALKSIPLFDDRGRPVPLQVDAKTGTLNFVSALAGYVEPFDGSPMVFAILTADMAARARITPGDEDRPPGTVGWTGRSRKLQFDLVRLWGESAA
jgi:D-alanyl-D-alanine carboxypeptidase/D-alanyl-D-alanine-endopeptidase (penicillin-binding protein 4)